MAVIYRIVNVVTDQFYIGSTDKPKRRKWEHWSELRRGAHHCRALQEAWLSYGEDAFEFEVVEDVGIQDKFITEDMHLLQHAGKPQCYNTALTSLSPPSVTAQTAEKIKASMLALYSDKNNHPRLGKAHTAQTKERISQSRTGKGAGTAHYRYGQTLSAEVKEKIGTAQRGIAKAPRTFTPAGLERARESMRRNAKEQVPVGFESVLAKFPEAVRVRYDFGNAVYTGALVRIAGIVCEHHGIFSQYSAQLRKGAGCPECGAVLRAQSKKAQMLRAWQDVAQREKMMAARSAKKLVPPTDL